MPTIYLECDKCHKTYSGEHYHPVGLHWSQEHLLRQEAKAAGWVEDNGRDFCPDCKVKG